MGRPLARMGGHTLPWHTSPPHRAGTPTDQGDARRLHRHSRRLPKHHHNVFLGGRVKKRKGGIHENKTKQPSVISLQCLQVVRVRHHLLGRDQNLYESNPDGQSFPMNAGVCAIKASGLPRAANCNSFPNLDFRPTFSMVNCHLNISMPCALNIANPIFMGKLWSSGFRFI